MALRKRHLTRTLGLLIALCAASFANILHGQTPPEKQVLFRALAVGNDAAFSGLFYDYKGTRVALPAGSSRLSTLFPSPPGGRLSLYRQTPPPSPGEPPGKTPVAEALIGKEGPYLLLLTSTPDNAAPLARKVMPLVVDEAVEIHPVRAIRLFNFSRRKIAAQINSDSVELAPAGSHVFTPSSEGAMIPFKIATWENETWELRLSSQTPLIDPTRSLMIITDVEPTPEMPNPVDVLAVTVFDDRPPPAKPKP